MNSLGCNIVWFSSNSSDAKNQQKLKCATNYGTGSFLAMIKYVHILNTTLKRTYEPAVIPETSV
jgi:hypothetical protein